jgi:hypothetical protein
MGRERDETCGPDGAVTCSGLQLSAPWLAIIGDLGSRLAETIGRVCLTLGDPGLTISETDLHSSAPAHTR